MDLPGHSTLLPPIAEAMRRFEVAEDAFTHARDAIDRQFLKPLASASPDGSVGQQQVTAVRALMYGPADVADVVPQPPAPAPAAVAPPTPRKRRRKDT